MTALADGLRSYEKYRITALLYDVPAALPNVDFLIVDLSTDYVRAVRLLELESIVDFASSVPRILCIADEADYRNILYRHLPGLPLSGFLSPVDIELRIGPALEAVDAGLSVYPAGYETVETEAGEHRTFDEASASSRLTPRELDVLLAVAAGLPNKAIASDLGVSERTVKFHLNSLFEKLDVHSRTEAAMEGTRRGLIPL